MVYNGRQIKMKKTLLISTSLAAVILFCSFILVDKIEKNPKTTTLPSYVEKHSLIKDGPAEDWGCPMPKLAGKSFTSENEETLDFYEDYVVYHAKGADYSRRGDYSIGNQLGTSGNPCWKRSLKVTIYVGDRSVTLSGRVEFKNATSINRLILNNEVWQ